MESSDPARFMEDLLNFGSGEKDEEESPQNGDVPTSFTQSALLTVLRPDDCSGPFADSPLIEEELEWISNKDAFPAVETFPGFLPSHYDDDVFLPAKQSSPVSVLETTTTTVTSSMSSGGSHSNSSIVVNCEKKARSKRRAPKQSHCSWYKHHGIYATQAHARRAPSLGRKCQHCGVEKTPQWRKGPNGPKTLCNACGVRYKSGRLVPEYRPANSPTFCSELHSNSHRKVVEMRMRKEMIGKGVG